MNKMLYTIHELEEQFEDFENSELIRLLVDVGFEDEVTGEEIKVAVDEILGEDTWYDSSGYNWAKQLQEADGKRVFSVADADHAWYMGLVVLK